MRTTEPTCVILCLVLIVATGLGMLVSVPQAVSALEDHQPILIQGNADLTSVNGVVSGSGTAGDPFIIDGWRIDSSAAIGIEVIDTDAYLIVQNVDVQGSGVYECVKMSGVSHATIRSSDVSSGSYGIHLEACQDISITGNSLHDNGDAVMLNPISDPSLCNWFVDVGDNLVTNNGRGFVSGPSYNSDIYRNQIISNSWAGVWLYCPTDTSVCGNVIDHDGSVGVWAESTTRTTIDSNNVSSCDIGIYLLTYHDPVAVGNLVTGNAIFENNVGLEILDTDAATVIGNDFFSNQDNAQTSGLANQWNGTYPSAGNYWADYQGVDFLNGPNQDLSGSDGIGDTPYQIDSENQDCYPLMSPATGSLPDWTELESITIACSGTAIEVDDEVILGAVGLTDSLTSIPGLIFTWSVNNSLGSVREAVPGDTSAVLFTGVGIGQCEVTATNGSITGHVTMVITEAYVSLDSDADGIPDWWELENNLDPYDPLDALADPDNDGLCILMEYLHGTSLNLADTDGDGLSDGVEVIFSGTDPVIVDTDGNGVSDGLQFIAEGGYTAIVEILPDNWISMTISWSSYTMYARSNSSVMGVSFDKEERMLSITVSGLEGTIGACELVLPMDMVGDSSNISISLDGEVIEFDVAQNGTYYTVTFLYEHSSHVLLADFAYVDETAPEDGFFSGTVLTYVVAIAIVTIAASVAAIIMVHRRRTN